MLATFTPDRDPFSWAQTQVNLGRISLELGEKEQSNERLNVAVQALDAAAKLPASRIGGSLQAQALFHGGKAHFEIGSRTGSLEELALAAGQMAAARQAYAAIGDEYQSIVAQFNEAIAYGKWADIDRDEASIARARSAFQNVKERARGAGQTDLVEGAGVMLERLPTQTGAAQ